MGLWDWLVLLALAALVVGAFLWMRSRKKKGHGCGGCCVGCPMQEGCTKEGRSDAR